MSFFLIAVNGGRVTEKKSNGLFDCTSDSSNAAQHWTVETDPSNDNIVAFQNASNGQYLRAFVGTAAGKVDTGDKQWWTMEPGHAPGSCWLKCNDYPDAYLCNSYANHVDNNKVYMWPKQLNWTHSMLWYFRDAKALGWKPQAASSSAATGASTDGETADELKEREAVVAEMEEKLKDVEQREADAKKREAELAEKEARVRDLEQKEAALKKKEQDLSASEAAQKQEADQLAAQKKELVDQHQKDSSGHSNFGDTDAKQAELQKKLEELKAAEKALAAKEAAMQKREQQNSNKEDELKKQEAELARRQAASQSSPSQPSPARSAGDDSAAKEAAMKRREQQNSAKETELKKREAELARKQAALEATPQPSPAQAKAGASEADLLKAENENLKLQLRLKDLERQLEEARRASSGTKATAAPSVGDNDGNAGQMAKLKEENARLKNLIAQQVKQKKDGQQQQTPSSKPSSGGAPMVNGAHSGPYPQAPNAAGPSVNGGSAREVPSASGHAAPVNGKPSGSGSAGGRPATAANGPSGTATKDFGRSGTGPQANTPKQRTQQPQGPPSAANGVRGSPNGVKPNSSPAPSKEAVSKPGKAGATGKQPPTSSPNKQDQTSKNALAAASKPRDPATKPVSSVAEDDEDVIRFSCGHVAYPPPRKLRKKMVGVLYEQGGKHGA
ncbi:hypothetical protein LTR85_011507 [Meristemomyces frigidus]|nr:hypothetical protein LTR85_011507 [Meristemomyces frigidus]